MTRVRWIIAAAALALVLAAAGWVAFRWLPPRLAEWRLARWIETPQGEPGMPPVVVTIDHGTGALEIARAIEEAGVAAPARRLLVAAERLACAGKPADGQAPRLMRMSELARTGSNVVAGLSLVLDGQEQFLATLLSRFYNGVDSFPLLAVPFFILAGELSLVPAIQVEKFEVCWSRIPGPRDYDIVLGLSLAELGSAAPTLAEAAFSCLGATRPETCVAVPFDPPSGDGFYFTVRANRGHAAGTYATGCPAEIPGRDEGVAVSATCP